MFLPLVGVHVFVLLWFLALASCAATSNETDHMALLHFKSKITHDPFRVLSSWNNSLHFCNWYGVTCGRHHRRVTMLFLPNKKLPGSISPYIGNLTFLRELKLSNNSFHSQFPPEIGGLRRLRKLQLSNNSIVGEIPFNMSACSNLIEFSVLSNELEGNIPAEIALLTKLEIIGLSINNITGTIPSSLGNLSSLRILYVAANNIRGTIPGALGNLKNLEKISIGFNQLIGTIPPSIFNLSRLQLIQMSSNKIEGNLSLDMGFTLPSLQFFDIYRNWLMGPIPITLSNASNLAYIDIGENQLSGRVPSLLELQSLQYFLATHNHLGSGGDGDLNFICSMINATSLKKIEISENNLGGRLPGCIASLSTTLTIFRVDHNKIRGSIPAGIGDLIGLEVLLLHDNNFIGVIPSTIGKLSKLKYLTLHENRLSGSIPSTFGNLRMLIHMHIYDNDLQGNIPPSLGKCQNLLTLDLHNNNLSGTIPPHIMSILSLIFLDLQNNHLTGTIPEEVGNLRSLEELHISRNTLVGKIPSSIGSCKSLQVLDMQGNRLQGNIPSSLSSLTGLAIIDFSQNNFSGEIPDFLETFQLEYLNLSYNDFEGAAPTGGVFKNSSATSVLGNKRLCGGIPQFHLHSCELNKSMKRRLSLLAKCVIASLCSVLGVAVILSFLLFWTRKKTNDSSSSDFENPPLRVSYQILHNATNGFSSANLVGVGHFGSVYKGILEQANVVVAIKVFNLHIHMAFKSFITECTALRNIRHRNLLEVLSACSSIDNQGNDFLAVVYPLMANGSLDEWLHSNHQSGRDESEEPRKLSFLQRLNIAIDVACALDYLHNDCPTPIVHCDLKPHNVLLDDEMIGHVGDFGLARLFLEATQGASLNHLSSLGIRGTIGYVAPEYGLGSDVAPKGDVYSYGILLLEMFTGKRPLDGIFNEELNLHSFSKLALPERVLEILDPCLIGEIEGKEEESRKTNDQCKSAILGCLVSIFELGVNCSVEIPCQRMPISDVVVQLQALKKKFFENKSCMVRNY